MLSLAPAGTTLHSQAGCGVPKTLEDFGRMFEKRVKDRWRKLKVCRPEAWGSGLGLRVISRRLGAQAMGVISAQSCMVVTGAGSDRPAFPCNPSWPLDSKQVRHGRSAQHPNLSLRRWRRQQPV